MLGDSCRKRETTRALRPASPPMRPDASRESELHQLQERAQDLDFLEKPLRLIPVAREGLGALAELIVRDIAKRRGYV